MKRIENCRLQIRDYQAILVFCETSDLTEVRETFIRINSLGMKLGAADRAFARASKFDMRGLVREAQARLGHNFDQVERTTILQTIALALGGRDLGERAIDGMISKLENSEAERTRFNRAWPNLRESLSFAVDFFVYEIGVPNFEFLPSEPMLTILALYFFHNGNVRPSLAARRQLQKWFWATAVGARYTGRGYRPNLLADAAFVERLSGNPRAHRSISSMRIPLHTLRTIDYSRPGPVSNGFFCLLRLSGPRYLEDGAKIPDGEISSRRNRSDKHHIFPRALLERHGIESDRFNSILNICYLAARENQSVGYKAPWRYFAEVPRNLRVRNASIRSHLIPSNPETGIWDKRIRRGFKTFLKDRALLLAKAFEQRAGVRLFERN